MVVESDILKSKGHTRVQWAVAMSVTTAVLSYGLQAGWISPMSKILQSEQSPMGRPLTDSELSLIAGLPCLAAVFGILTLVWIVDTYGRKRAILFLATFQLICWLVTLFSRNFYSLIIARLCCGIGAGGSFHVIPMYIKEISQDDIRGTLVSMPTMCQNLGILIMYALGGYLNYYSVLYLVIGLPVFTILVSCFTPESPSFLVKQGKLADAAANVAFLRGFDVNDKRVEAEIELIKKEREYFETIPKTSFFDIFKDKAVRRGFIIMVIVICVHGLNGAFSIVNYAAILLADSEIKISTELQTLMIPICLIIGTCVTMCGVDKMGRKLMLGVSLGISALTFSVLGSSTLLRGYGWATPGWLPIIVILVTGFCYGAGVSPVPFILMTEMFNFQIRAKVMACICILAWSMVFVQLVSFTAISNAFGVYTSFYVFAAINLIGVITVVILLPETRGKSVEEIEKKLRGTSKFM